MSPISAPSRVYSARDVAELYASKGKAFLTEICGAFAIVIVDGGQRALLAIDRMGIEKLTFLKAHGVLTVSSDARMIAKVPGVDARISPQRLFDFLFFHMIPSPDVVFTGMKKLEPATCVEIEGDRITEQRYWNPSFDRKRGPSTDKLGLQLLPSLEQAIRDSHPTANSGAFLSGGLDSSTVAGLLERVIGPGAPTFSIGFSEPGYDELDFARIARNRFGCRGFEYTVGPRDLVPSIAEIAGACDEPFGNSSAVAVWLCAKLAKSHGIDHLFAGDGGDELFAGNERYATQKIFETYRRLPVWLRGAANALASRLQFGPFKKLSSFTSQAQVRLPERLEAWNYVYREDITRVLAPDFLAAIDIHEPLRRMNDIFCRIDSMDPLDRQLAYDWHFTLADNDLRKVQSMCDHAEVRVTFPMLDYRIVDLSLQVPSSKKLTRLNLRTFYKTAVNGFLPAEIIGKSKHGFGVPFGHWMKSDSEITGYFDFTLERLKSRRIFESTFIDSAQRSIRDAHPGYHGYFLWDLVMLEEWLRRNADSFRA